MSSAPGGEDDADSTLDAVIGIGEEQRATHGLWARRAMVAVLVVIIAAAGSGFLGVRSATASASSDGYQVSVTYARIARAGLDVPFTIRVQAPRPIVTGVVIGISANYSSFFASQGPVPEPSDIASDSDTVYFAFAPPPSGNVLVVNFDASVQPATQQGEFGRIRVKVDGTWRVSADVRTTLIP